MSFTDFILPRLRRLGIDANVDERNDVVTISLDERSVSKEIVLCATAKTPSGERIISCFAPAFPFPQDQKLASAIALALMRRNARLSLVKWELTSDGDDGTFRLCVDLVANTLDDEELRAALDMMILEAADFQKELQKSSINF